MKHTILLFGSLFFLFSCSTENREIADKELITKYYQALNSGDFSQVSKLVSDSLVTLEMDFLLTKGKQEFHVQYQWDSVFNAKHKLLDIHTKGDSIFVMHSKLGKRIEFLQDTAIVCQLYFEIENHKISKIHTIDYTVFKLEKWLPRRDSLVSWIDRNHPQLNGFIYDLSPQGAANYLEAIEYYARAN